MSRVISVNKLSKHFQTFQRRPGVLGAVKDLFYREYSQLKAVDEISFEVEQGELLGYLGPNGAGKSTSIKMLTGILKPSAGEMDVLGMHPFRDRKKYTRSIGVVFGQRTQLWWDIAVQESFRLLKSIYEIADSDYQQRFSRLTEILELEPLLRTPVRKLSLGQRVRCDLAASLLHGPKILFLDEPTIGLDTVAKSSVRAFLKRINQEFRTTIILTTHDLTEIEELCQRIVILDKGHIVYDGALSSVKNLPGLKRQLIVDFSRETNLESFRQRFADRLEAEKAGEGRYILRFDPRVLPAVDLLKELVEKCPVADLTLEEPGIEEVIGKIYRDGL